MSTFNINQPIDIKLDTTIDLSVGTNPRIRWKNQNGSTGYFTGTIQEGNKIHYKTSASDITIPGNWEFRACIEIGGVDYLGEPVIRKFVAP